MRAAYSQNISLKCATLKQTQLQFQLVEELFKLHQMDTNTTLCIYMRGKQYKNQSTESLLCQFENTFTLVDHFLSHQYLAQKLPTLSAQSEDDQQEMEVGRL